MFLLDGGDHHEFILVGIVSVEHMDERTESHEFIVHATVEGPETQRPMLQHYQVLVPSAKA